MKTKSKLGAYVLRASTTALLFSCVIVALCSAINLPEQPPKALPPPDNAVFGANAHQSRSLSFADRVAYQRAIEDVYWRHRIWPKENPAPKPALDAVMSQAQLENKVAGYLRDSLVLEDYWQRPITAEQLQAEMYRKNGNNVRGGGCAWPPTPFDHFGVAEITFHSCSEATRLPDHDNRTTRWLS